MGDEEFDEIPVVDKLPMAISRSLGSHGNVQNKVSNFSKRDIRDTVNPTTKNSKLNRIRRRAQRKAERAQEKRRENVVKEKEKSKKFIKTDEEKTFEDVIRYSNLRHVRKKGEFGYFESPPSINEEEIKQEEPTPVPTSTFTKSEKKAFREKMLAKKHLKKEQRELRRSNPEKPKVIKAESGYVSSLPDGIGICIRDPVTIREPPLTPEQEEREYETYIFNDNYQFPTNTVENSDDVWSASPRSHSPIPERKEEKYYFSDEEEDIVEHIIDSPETMDMLRSNFTKYLPEYVEGASTVADHSMRVLIFCYQMWRGSKTSDYMAAVCQFAGTYGVKLSDVYDGVKDILRRVKHYLKAWVLPRTESGCLSKVADFWDFIVNSHVVQALRDIFLTIVGYRFFSKDFAQRVYELMGSCRPIPFIQLVPEMLRSLEKLYKCAVAFYSGAPLCEALYADDPMAMSIQGIIDCQRRENLTYTGLPEYGMTELKEYLCELKNYIDILELGVKDLGKWNHKTKIYREKMLQGRELYARKVAELGSGTRDVPFAFVIWGAPQTGKSKVLPYTFELWSRVKGREFNMTQVYQKSPTAKFWDGYSAAQHPYLHCSEVGRLRPEIAKARGDPMLEEVLSMADSLPYPLDYSAIENKGKHFLHIECMGIDTNNRTLGVDALYSNPAAVARRFVYVEVKVKPEFRIPGTQAIDSSASYKAGGDLMDRYLFWVRTYDANGNSDTRENLVCSGGDIYEYTTCMSMLMKGHVEKNMSSNRILKPSAAKAENGMIEDIVDDYYETRESIKDLFGFVFNLIQAIVAIFGYYIVEMGLQWLHFCRAGIGSGKHVGYVIILALALSIMSHWYYHGSVIMVLFLILHVSLFSGWNADTNMAYIMELQARRKHIVEKVKWYTGIIETINPYKEYLAKHAGDLRTVVGLIAISGAFAGTIALIVSYFQKKKPQAQNGSLDNVRAFDNSQNEKYQWGSTHRRVKTKTEGIWNIQKLPTPPLHMGDLSSLSRKALGNARYCEVYTGVGYRPMKTHILGVCRNIALINKHNFHNVDKIVLKISRTGGIHDSNTDSGWQDLVLHKDLCFELNSDTLGFVVPGMKFKNLIKHFSTYETNCAVAGHFINEGTRLVMHPKNSLQVQVKGDPLVVSGYIQYSFARHAPGMCGLPVIGECLGGGVIAGIHMAGEDGGSTAYGILVSRAMVDTAVEHFISTNKQFVTVGEAEHGFLDLEDPIVKSMVHYELMHDIDYLGKIPGNVCPFEKSKLIKNPRSEEMDKIMKKAFPSVTFTEFDKPIMRTSKVNGQWSNPYNLTMRTMASRRKTLDPEVLIVVKDVLVKRIKEGLSLRGIKSLCPLNLEQAINGVEGDAYISRINPSTAAGFGFKGKKSEFLPLSEGDKRGIAPELLVRVAEVLSTYEDGDCMQFVYKAKLKDEPRSVKKVSEGKTRVFYMSPLDCLIVSRMFLKPFYALMAQHRELFCTSVGIDMHRAADDMYMSLKSFSENIIEGDYGNYDLLMPFGVGDTANQVIYEVLEYLGYNKSSLSIVRGILTDNLFPAVLILMDLFVAAGLQPSGKDGTAEDNSLRGLILLMYAWYSNPDFRDRNFFQYVLPNTYGDDLVGSSKEERFNNNYYCDFVRENYGMTFTSPDKSAAMEDFTTLQKMSFLKRTFQPHKALNRIVAVLDPSSIRRSLMWRLPSDSISEEEQAVATGVSALWELFLHLPRSEWESVRSNLIDEYAIRFSASAVDMGMRFPQYHFILNNLKTGHEVHPTLQDEVEESDCL